MSCAGSAAATSSGASITSGSWSSTAAVSAPARSTRGSRSALRPPRRARPPRSRVGPALGALGGLFGGVGGAFGNALQLHLRDFAADQLRDLGQELTIFARGQRECAAFIAGTASTADAMDVGVGVVGHVEIEDVGQAADVDTARGDIGADQQAEFVVLEFLQRLGARRLRHVAMKLKHIEPVPLQRAIEDIHVALAGCRRSARS